VEKLTALVMMRAALGPRMDEQSFGAARGAGPSADAFSAMTPCQWIPSTLALCWPAGSRWITVAMAWRSP